MVHRIRVAGLVRSGDDILLIKQQNRQGLKCWSIPGGRLEPTDENIFRGAEREVWEETGLRVVAGPLRFISEHLAPDLFALTLIVECYLAEGEVRENIHLSNLMEDDNIDDVAWWPTDAIKGAIEPMSQNLGHHGFWEALEGTSTTIYLGRHNDE